MIGWLKVRLQESLMLAVDIYDFEHAKRNVPQGHFRQGAFPAVCRGELRLSGLNDFSWNLFEICCFNAGDDRGIIT